MKTLITREGLKHAVDECIAHWERMLAWVEKQDPTERLSYLAMHTELHEDPAAIYCALCNYLHSKCTYCPIAQTGGLNTKGCRDASSTYHYTVHGGTYEQLAARMLLMIDVLKRAKEACRSLPLLQFIKIWR